MPGCTTRSFPSRHGSVSRDASGCTPLRSSITRRTRAAGRAARPAAAARTRRPPSALEHHAPHVRCGKLVVAQQDEIPELEGLIKTAAANNATLVPVDQGFVRAHEPAVRAAGAFWSPDSGWIEAEPLARTLQNLATHREVALLTGTPFVAAE